MAARQGGVAHTQQQGQQHRQPSEAQGIEGCLKRGRIQQNLPRCPCLRRTPRNRRQRQHATQRQQHQGRRQQRVLTPTARRLRQQRLYRVSTGGAAAEPSIGQRRQQGDGQHQPHQHTGFFHRQLIGNQLINFHFDGGVIAATQQQGQAKAGKAIQKHQTHAARQPRQQHRPLHLPKTRPRARTQGLRRPQPRSGHLQKALIRRAHQHRQVKKHIAVQQQIRRVLPTRPQQAVRAKQSQHAHAGHQRGHHKR